MTIAAEKIYSVYPHGFLAAAEAEPVSNECSNIPLTETDLVLLELSSDWIRFDVPLRDLSLLDPERMLLINRRLRGGVKICMAPGGGPRLRLELALGPSHGEETDNRTSMALITLRNALVLLEQIEDPTSFPEQEYSCDGAADIAAICSASGWKCLPREGGRWVVELDTAPDYCQADITVVGMELMIEVVLGEWPAIKAISYEASIDLLAKACSGIRACRAAIEPPCAESGTQFLLQANVARADVETDLLPALSALSVGFRRLQHELGALQYTEIADAYLAISSRQSGRDYTHR